MPRPRQSLDGALPAGSRRTNAIIDTLTFRPLDGQAPDAVEALLDAAFGPERRTRTAYRLRDGVAALPELSFAAVDEAGALIGSLQSWPIELAADDGRIAPLVLLGPIAVRPDRQRDGIGRRMTAHALSAMDARGIDAVVLIGDPEYYGRFFGFDDAATGGWRVPGPVERRRLLARLAPGLVLPREGALRARRD